MYICSEYNKVFFRETDMSHPKSHAKQHDSKRADEGRKSLRESATMGRLLDALEEGTDVGHFGRLTFAIVARHFLGEDDLVGLLASQPEQDEASARALVLQVQQRDYNPPRRERLLEWQKQQDFALLPDADDPTSGNLYRELRFPDGIYDHIHDFWEEKAEAHESH